MFSPRAHAHEVRLFVVGLGAEVDRDACAWLARAGHGTVEFVGQLAAEA